MNNEYRWKLKYQVMKKEFVIIYCKYVYIKSTFNVINIVLFVSEEEKKDIQLWGPVHGGHSQVLCGGELRD